MAFFERCSDGLFGDQMMVSGFRCFSFYRAERIGHLLRERNNKGTRVQEKQQNHDTKLH